MGPDSEAEPATPGAAAAETLACVAVLRATLELELDDPERVSRTHAARILVRDDKKRRKVRRRARARAERRPSPVTVRGGGYEPEARPTAIGATPALRRRLRDLATVVVILAAVALFVWLDSLRR